MLLRWRLTLLFSFFIGALVTAVLILDSLHASYERDRLTAIASRGQLDLWNTLARAEEAQVVALARSLASAIATGAPGIDPRTVRRISAEIIDDEDKTPFVEIVDRDGSLAFSNTPTFRYRQLFGSGAIASLNASSDRVITGFRQARPDTFVTAALVPLEIDGAWAGAVGIGVPADGVLDEFADITEEASFLLSRRGRLVNATDPELWQATQPQLAVEGDSHEFADADDRIYFAVASPLADLVSGIAGTLVTMRDVTTIMGPERRVYRLGLLGLAIGLTALIIAVSVGLWVLFRPLEDATSALSALARGETDRVAEPDGVGEVRVLSQNVSAFRRSLIRLSEQDARIERQRRRQERVIRRQLQNLATTLDDDGRTAVEQDLAKAFAGNEVDDDANLTMLADILSGLSSRITTQHVRLTELIEELKDSIVTRARLAGLEQELEIARSLQQSFLPNPLPPMDDVAVAGLMEPAKEVGGDFFDYFMIDEHRLAVVVADVSGKGVPAALFMAITRTLIKATVQDRRNPADALDAVNGFLVADNEQMMFVTLFLGVLDRTDGTFTYVNAGHNPPVRVGGGEATLLPSTGDLMLGVVEDASFHQSTLRLKPGERLVLYTDGVTEAFNPMSEAFGEERLLLVLSANGNQDAETLAETVRDSVLRFEAGAERADDLTCAVLSYRGMPVTAAADQRSQVPSQSSPGVSAA